MTGGVGMTACASAVDGSGSTATEVSAGAGLSGGVERSMTASNVSATPPGSAIHPPLRKAETIGSRNRWAREAGWGGDGGCGALPCHSHKPDSWFSALGDVVFDDTIASPLLKTRNAAAIDKLTRCVLFRGPAEIQGSGASSILSRPSRNQTGISNALHPRPYGLFLDDLPIHIRPDLPAARVQT